MRVPRDGSGIRGVEFLLAAAIAALLGVALARRPADEFGAEHPGAARLPRRAMGR
jgi:hypothetical protein